MKKFTYLFILISALSAVGCGSATTQDTTENVVTDTTVTNADEAMKLLKEGNARFVADDSEVINVSSVKRGELENGQAPYAIVISCSDSRVTPSHVFNAGLGELFEIRLAGNVVDDYALGSIEYGVEHLHTPLLVVMGHESCGAVTAAFEAYQSNTKPEGEISSLIKAIIPSIESVNASSVEEASHQNVQNTIEVLKQNPIIAEAVNAGHLQIVGAYYDLDGKVTFLE